jgi:hypothetical protein
MLLRSVTKHVKDQNWFAVALDFFLVVAGVFIGLQVNDWNAQRVEQSLEQEYLERLRDDVEESRNKTKRVTASWLAQIDHLNVVIDSLDKCEIADDEKDDFAEGLFNLGKFELAYLNISTIEEMKSTGRFGIIENIDIRDGLSQLESETYYQERVEPQIIARLSPHIEYVGQRFRIQIANLDDATKMNEKVGDEDFKFSDVTSYSLDTLCSDSKFIASISFVRRELYEMMDWNTRIAEFMDTALVKIEEELGEMRDGR